MEANETIWESMLLHPTSIIVHRTSYNMVHSWCDISKLLQNSADPLDLPPLDTSWLIFGKIQSKHRKRSDMNVMLRPVEPQKAAGYEAMRHKAAGYEAHTYSQRTSEKIPFLRGLPLIFMISLRLQGHCLNCLGKHFVST